MEKSYKKTDNKLYSVLDILSTVGTAGGPVMALQGFLISNSDLINYGILIFSTSLAYHCGNKVAEKQFIETGLEKKVKKK